MCGIYFSTSVASEHPISGPGSGGEVEANGEGTFQWQHCPEHPEPGGICPIPAAVYIWITMEMAAGHLCSLCIAVSLLLC